MVTVAEYIQPVRNVNTANLVLIQSGRTRTKGVIYYKTYKSSVGTENVNITNTKATGLYFT